MVNEKDKIIICNDQGEEQTFYQLMTFSSKETEKEYILYTDNTINDNHQLNIYSSILVGEGDSIEFIPVVDNKDKDIVKEAIIQLKLKLMDDQV